MKYPNTYAKINLDNLVSNFKLLVEKSGGKIPMCIVKADAYGHGAPMCVKALEENGAKHFAVASIDEAEILRQNGVKNDILILGYIPSERIDEVCQYNLTVALYSLKFARMLSDYALKSSKIVDVHIKLNTGMNRLGFPVDDNCIKIIKQISQMEGLCIKGVFSHYSCADEADKSFSILQRDRFVKVVTQMKQAGIDTGIVHISNSAATLSFECKEANAFRPGIALYGVSPFPDYAFKDELKPVMTFLTSVANTYKLKKGDSVGYSRNYEADSDRKMAILCAGYADGYFRALSNTGDIYIHSKRAHICGNICMDMMAADITDINDVRVGDKAELFGENISVCELADKIGTIPYEIMCSVSKRVKRIYK